MSDIQQNERLDEILTALGEQLEALEATADLVVIGGSALIALGTIERATRDVDIVALRQGQELVSADPLPAQLATARDRVARDFGLDGDWLNPGPTDLLELGLPHGFAGRLESRSYGPSLTVRFASRIDQIHFKLYALVDRGPGRHESDLRALSPQSEELLTAARWARTHDPSPGFKTMLEEVLDYLEVNHGDLGA
ncbi:MAG: hypothetical protein QOE75_706 [Solirubrobacterales bacterium]|nr:hypothetical protein [Solirubrobacterales bacterium]